jgi:hypothetical protein
MCIPYALQSQDLNARVTVNADQIQLSDKSVFKELERSIFEFLNNRKWTTDKVNNDERLNCTFVFIIEQFTAPDYFKGSLQIQSTRPAYASSYNSVLLNLKDDKIEFKYNSFQAIEYNENSFTNNLSSILSYYTFIMLGLDYDSFGDNAGLSLLLRAQSIVSTAQSISEIGWQAFDLPANRNKYWLADNLTNSRFKEFHTAIYNYHRKGVDQMSKDLNAGRKEVLTSLEQMEKVFRLSNNLYMMSAFFQAKADEIILIFKDAEPQDKNKAVEILNKISVQNQNKWQTILQK